MKLNKLLLTLFLFSFPFALMAFAGADNAGSDVLNMFKSSLNQMQNIFILNGLYLFGVFVVIALTLEFGFKFLQGELELGGIMAALIRNMLIFGIFNLFITEHFLQKIKASFIKLGIDASTAAGVGVKPSVDTIFESAYEVLKATTSAFNGFALVDSLALIIIGVIASIGVILIGVELLMVYIKASILITISPLIIAMGVWSTTRNWAISTITATIQASVEYMILLIIVGLSVSNIKKYAKLAMTDEGSLFALLIMVLIIFGLTKMANNLANSLFTGNIGGNSTSAFSKAAVVGGAAAVGAGAGAIGGTMGGISSIKEANSVSGGGSKAGTIASAMGGAMGGAMSGVTKGAYSGATSHSMGSAISAATRKGAGEGAGKNTVTGAKWAGGQVDKMMESTYGTSSSPSSANKDKNLDRYGFDLNQVKTDNAKGEIKPS